MRQFMLEPGDSQVSKVGASGRSDPQADSSRDLSEFQVVNDQTGLRGIVDEKTELHSANVEFHFRPGIDFKIDIRFIHAGKLVAEFLPPESRMGGVLAGVIALKLVSCLPFLGRR